MKRRKEKAGVKLHRLMVVMVTLFTLAIDFSGCCLQPQPLYCTAYIEPEPIYVSTAPPETPIVQVTRPPQPDPTYIWIEGYWSWTGSDWIWIHGYWAPPRPGYYWVPPKVTHVRGRGYAYVPGHWKKYREGHPPRRTYTEGRPVPPSRGGSTTTAMPPAEKQIAPSTSYTGQPSSTGTTPSSPATAQPAKPIKSSSPAVIGVKPAIQGEPSSQPATKTGGQPAPSGYPSGIITVPSQGTIKTGASPHHSPPPATSTSAIPPKVKVVSPKTATIPSPSYKKPKSSKTISPRFPKGSVGGKAGSAKSGKKKYKYKDVKYYNPYDHTVGTAYKKKKTSGSNTSGSFKTHRGSTGKTYSPSGGSSYQPYKKYRKKPMEKFKKPTIHKIPAPKTKKISEPPPSLK